MIGTRDVINIMPSTSWNSTVSSPRHSPCKTRTSIRTSTTWELWPRLTPIIQSPRSSRRRDSTLRPAQPPWACLTTCSLSGTQRAKCGCLIATTRMSMTRFLTSPRNSWATQSQPSTFTNWEASMWSSAMREAKSSCLMPLNLRSLWRPSKITTLQLPLSTLSSVIGAETTLGRRANSLRLPMRTGKHGCLSAWTALEGLLLILSPRSWLWWEPLSMWS